VTEAQGVDLLAKIQTVIDVTYGQSVKMLNVNNWICLTVMVVLFFLIIAALRRG
jgi:hypothetical protein